MVSEKMVAWGSQGCVIRDLAAYGEQRAAVVGAENVFNFTIGNPSVPAPSCVRQTIEQRFVMPCRVPVVWIFLQLFPHLGDMLHALHHLRAFIAQDVERRLEAVVFCPHIEEGNERSDALPGGCDDLLFRHAHQTLFAGLVRKLIFIHREVKIILLEMVKAHDLISSPQQTDEEVVEVLVDLVLKERLPQPVAAIGQIREPHLELVNLVAVPVERLFELLVVLDRIFERFTLFRNFPKLVNDGISPNHRQRWPPIAQISRLFSLIHSPLLSAHP